MIIENRNQSIKTMGYYRHYDEELVSRVRADYPQGTRVMCDLMEDDPHPIEAGETGTVQYVDDAASVCVRWDSGRILSLLWGKDRFHRI